ncbi:MAG: 2'-5' RNA ligase family protein [Chlorogloeopsis fritschii C42_A2020_084]|jgi:2'-5' RNA ligase|uniref:2'-5' RNA ligase family protein n=1 Tax=Chlorogloeopsis fritschii TaxID=1124 RepID=UPI0019F61762|nr:2'-5' RNA ligase family protein [Chlorogloeopsis fritschii]MBF2009407.1 2'-5' RNA ligase family protein [Chlorogloeopsis fritschii C42_A2020_084]
MQKTQHLFFIALLPPQEIQDYANQIKQYFADKYASRHAQKSPPHITLQPPFEWTDENVPALEECLQEFASGHKTVPVTLNGYAAFVPRVIYINVVRSPDLLALQANLMAHLESKLGIVDKVSKTRPFAPHMTVAFKDLTKQNFKAAWPEFEKRELYFEFTANSLTLLFHDGKRWNIKSEFSFAQNEKAIAS